ncbi:unnamed protein product [Schistosoma curassoni]|uniref:Uncharacterized protein n=1 Tax=Schistosoma curassoni TaxID=6186 RepID=A0A183KD17_9TREM|nr:unnamed protein product [Schistosoma curassoni]
MTYAQPPQKMPPEVGYCRGILEEICVRPEPRRDTDYFIGARTIIVNSGLKRCVSSEIIEWCKCIHSLSSLRLQIMTGTYVTAQAKFTKLRKRLDQLGYKQPLGLDSLPLVERLFYDLVWTTENLRKVRSELSSQIQIRSTVEDYIAPYKADNGKLIRENNEINHHLMVLRQDYEENIRGS